jgi:hypothetical protein
MHFLAQENECQRENRRLVATENEPEGLSKPSRPCSPLAPQCISQAGPCLTCQARIAQTQANGSLLREHGPTAAGTVRNLVFVCCARKPGPSKQTVSKMATVPAAILDVPPGKEPCGFSRPTECVFAQGRSGGGSRNGLGWRNRPRVAPWDATLAQVRKREPRSRCGPG